MAVSVGVVVIAVTRRGRLLVVFEGLFGRTDDVGDVKKCVAFETEVNERLLHAGQHFRDAALVDVADDAPLPFALDEDFSDEIVFENGHHGCGHWRR